MSRVIALVSYYPDTRFLRLVRALSKIGCEIVVVGWDRREGHHRKEDNMEEKKIIALRLFKLNIPLDPIITLMILPIWEIFVFIHLLKEKYDIIHAVNLDTAIPALVVSRIKRKPMIFDIFDLYADSASIVQKFSFLRKLIYKIERFVIKRADIVIIADESRKEQIGRDITHSIVIYNAPLDISHHNFKIIKKNKDYSCVVFFGGGISPDRNIHNMVKAVRDLNHVTLILKGPAKAGYDKILLELSDGTKNIQLGLKWTSPDIIRAYTQYADVLFALYDPNILPNNKYASPNKLFEAMLYKKPVIVSKGTSMATKVEIHKCGLTVDPNNVEEIKRAITILCENPKLRKKLGHNGKKVYEKKYSWRIMEKILINLYNNILQLK